MATGIIDRSYYGAAQQGRNDRMNEQNNMLRQQGMQQELAQNTLNQQRQQQADQAAQVKEFATQMHAAAQYAQQAPPGQTKAFVQQNFPQLVEKYGPDWNTATDEQVKQQLAGFQAQFGAQLGMGPAPPTPPPGVSGAMYKIVDDNGNPVYADAAGAKGKKPYSEPKAIPAGEQYDPTSVENTAQMIANSQIPMISGFALKSKWGQEVVSRVRELNPEYAGADYGSNAAGLKQFTSGKNGNTIRSLNVAVQHLDQLGQLATALNNSDLPSINRLSILWKKSTGQAAPTNFDTAKKIVADEIVKAIVGSGGGVADREEAAKAINNAGSPEQLQQAITTYQGLMTGQLNGLREQYKAATGRDNFESMLLPETRAKLEVHGQQAPQAGEVTATGPGGKKLVLRNGQWVPL